MSTRAILVLIFVILSGCVNAQVNLGVRAGLNLNDIRVSNYPGGAYPSQTRAGFHIGIYSTLRLVKEKIYFIPEVRFVERGFSYDKNNTKNTVALSYIELPLIFSYKLNGLISIDVGPSVAFRTASTGVFNGTNMDVSSVYKRPVDAGIHLGIRYALSDRLSLIARYYYGMKYIYFFYHGPNNIYLSEFYNKSLEIGAAYSFQLKKKGKNFNQLKRALDPPRRKK